MNERLRRHARLIAGSLALLLVAGIGYALRSAGTAGARPARAVRQVHAIAPVLAPASKRRAAAARAQTTSGGGQQVAAAAAVHSRSVQAGHSTPAPHATSAPTRQALSQSLQRATGLSLTEVTSRPVCPRATPGHAACAAQAVVRRSNGALVHPRVARSSSLGRVSPAATGGTQPAAAASATPPAPGTPAYLQEAYDLSYLSQNGGANDTVAIVDAFDDPTAEADLAVYRSNYGLPACTTANGCFQKVGQDGSSSLPAPDAGWDQEIALDLDSVSAICPNCHILLVETNSSLLTDLEAGMETAASLGADQISDSWFGTSGAVPPMFHTFAGIATVAASGDYGYPGAGQDNYPAALPGVTAAGGTSLAAATGPSARGFGESAWSWNGLNGGGSGCDVQFPRPAYQPAEGCSGRAYTDVSADADPDTGLSVYDHGKWTLVGGTSLSTPLIAAYYAITGVAGTTPQWAYGDSGVLNDVVSGDTGDCAPSIAYICNAGPGFDGPTGMGSISGAVITGAPGVAGPAIGSGSGNTYTQSVAAHSATIAGGIYRNGLDTSWWVEYGTDTTYGHQTTPSDIGAGSAPVSVTGYLSQLTPSTTYHYRLVAHNSVGTTYGYDYTFTTPAAPNTPTAAFSFSPTPPTPGASIGFNASASKPPSGGSISDYSWNFGDGTATLDKGGSTTANHTYARGTYTVTLTVRSNNGQTDVSRQSVTVDDPPTAAFTRSGTAVPSGTPVTFDASSSTAGAGGSITDYSWSFGDGTTTDAGAAKNESHTFTTPSTYTVTLTTTDDLNVTDTVTHHVTVANFSASPAIPAPGQRVTLTAVDVGDACGTATGYTWDFGDTSDPVTTTGPSVNYTYASRGSYTVSLSVQCTGTPPPNTSATLHVDDPPTATFMPSATVFAPGTTVSFDGSGSSADTGGTITDYKWSFGDGSPAVDTGSTATAQHAYPVAGIYTVTLTTTDELGATGSSSQQVTADEPTAAFRVSSSNPAPNAPVSFDASTTTDPESTIAHYVWDFGDGATLDAGASPITTHSFGTAGTYTVKLTVTDQLGLMDTASHQVVIAPSVTQTSNPPPTTTTTTTTTTPVTPTPTPTPAPPVTNPQAPLALVAQVSGGGRQRLTRFLAHGFRLGLSVNQSTRASFQITIPIAQTRQGSNHKGNPKATVVLLRGAQTLAAGHHTITLKLSRAAAHRLASHGSLVLTMRVTFTGASGSTATRTVKLTLTR